MDAEPDRGGVAIGRPGRVPVGRRQPWDHRRQFDRGPGLAGRLGGRGALGHGGGACGRAVRLVPPGGGRQGARAHRGRQGSGRTARGVAGDPDRPRSGRRVTEPLRTGRLRIVRAVDLDAATDRSASGVRPRSRLEHPPVPGALQRGRTRPDDQRHRTDRIRAPGVWHQRLRRPLLAFDRQEPLAAPGAVAGDARHAGPGSRDRWRPHRRGRAGPGEGRRRHPGDLDLGGRYVLEARREPQRCRTRPAERRGRGTGRAGRRRLARGLARRREPEIVS